MREIKFKAWDVEKEKMIVVDQMTFRINGDVFKVWDSKISDDVPGLLINPSSGILMQYIGMSDKNGMEIYEGDKVRLPMWLARDDPARGSYWYEGVVVYKDCGFMIESEDDGFYDNMGALFSWDELEIIGDIHCNPDCVGATT